jgi:hypothetical protein
LSKESAPQYVLKEEPAVDAAAAQKAAEAARAEERRMLRNARLGALLLMAVAGAIGWLELHTLRSENKFHPKGIIVVVTCAIVGPIGLLWPRVMVGISRNPKRVDRRYRVIGLGLSIGAAVVGALLALRLSGTL